MAGRLKLRRIIITYRERSYFYIQSVSLHHGSISITRARKYPDRNKKRGNLDLNIHAIRHLVRLRGGNVNDVVGAKTADELIIDRTSPPL